MQSMIHLGKDRSTKVTPLLHKLSFIELNTLDTYQIQFFIKTFMNCNQN